MNVRMDPHEKALLDREVDKINNDLFVKDKENGRVPKQMLDKDDFLQLLLKQMSYQDPLSPMENTEFSAQMAQFSSLEHIKSMSQSFANLSNTLTRDFSRISELITGSEAASALGKNVEVDIGDGRTIEGVVSAVTKGGDPMVKVNGLYYNWSRVTEVFE
jgi:flagellar basal-body rod modification protein FlgD